MFHIEINQYNSKSAKVQECKNPCRGKPSAANIASCLKTDIDVVTLSLTFDLLTPKYMVFEDSSWSIFCAKFGYPSCIRF